MENLFIYYDEIFVVIIQIQKKQNKTKHTHTHVYLCYVLLYCILKRID